MKAAELSTSSTLISSTHPLAWLAVAFALGMLIAAWTAIDWKITLGLSVLASIPAFLLRGRMYSGAIIFAAFIFLGAFCYQSEIAGVRDDRIKVMYDLGEIASASPVEIEGMVMGRPEPSIDGSFIRLSVSRIRQGEHERPASGVVRLFVPLVNDEQMFDFASLDMRSGSLVRVACELIREDQYLNPGVQSKRQLLDQQGIDATATVKSSLLIEPLGESSFPSVLDFVYGQRGRLIDEFRSRFSPSTSGVLIASMLGDKHFLDKETADVFRDGGTFHVLVISGLHITFIGGLLLWFISLFTSDRRMQLVLVGGFLWTYSVAVGGEVPVVRACLMFTAFLVSRVIYRSSNLLNTLGLSCLILMAWRPSDVFSPSFQLTVVSVASIVVIAFPLIEKLREIGAWMPDASNPFPPNVHIWMKRSCEMLYWREKVWEIDQERQIWSARIFKIPYLATKINGFAKTLTGYAFEGLLVSAIVQICMLPLTIYYFHRVTPVAIFLNLWVGLFIALESFAALLAVVFGVFSNALAFPFTMIAEGFNWLLISLPKAMTYSGWASFRVPIYSGEMKLIYLIYFVPLLSTAYFLFRWDPFDLFNRTEKFAWRIRRISVSVAAVLVLASIIVFHPFSAPRPDGKLHVEFLDVGQGDSALVTFPDGQTMLIDGGGMVAYRNDDEDDDQIEPDIPRIGEMVVSEFLWEKGYSRIDHLVASHADADHAQGLADVVSNFDVGEIYIGAWPHGASELDELFAAAAKRSVPTKQVGRGDRFEIGGVLIETVWPTKGRALSGSDNNSSIVMRLIYKDRSFLFTGDIERDAENELTTGTTQLNADVVKVPHHGSRTSSSETFVERTKAKWAVIPVGRRSRFGHPHPEVIERWKKAGIQVLRTGEKGAVHFVTDGREVKVGTFLP